MCCCRTARVSFGPGWCPLLSRDSNCAALTHRPGVAGSQDTNAVSTAGDLALYLAAKNGHLGATELLLHPGHFNAKGPRQFEAVEVVQMMRHSLGVGTVTLTRSRGLVDHAMVAKERAVGAGHTMVADRLDAFVEIAREELVRGTPPPTHAHTHTRAHTHTHTHAAPFHLSTSGASSLDHRRTSPRVARAEWMSAMLLQMLVPPGPNGIALRTTLTFWLRSWASCGSWGCTPRARQRRQPEAARPRSAGRRRSARRKRDERCCAGVVEVLVGSEGD